MNFVFDNSILSPVSLILFKNLSFELFTYLSKSNILETTILDFLNKENLFLYLIFVLIIKVYPFVPLRDNILIDELEYCFDNKIHPSVYYL